MEYKGFIGLKPESDSVKKWWLYTRKRSKDEFLSIGDFKYSGLYTTQSYRSDKLFFSIALLSEIGFLVAVTIMVGGFDILLSLSAIVCVVLDFIGAYLFHKNENEICKAQLGLNIVEYKEKIKRSESGSIKGKKHQLDELKKVSARSLGATLIIISAVLKILGSVVLFEMPVFSVVLTVVYCFVAWIHIKKTGFWFSGWKFFGALDTELKTFIKEDRIDKIRILNEENDFGYMEIENIPENVELKTIRMKVISNSNIFDSIEKKENKWRYRIWKHSFWDDIDLQNFINSKDENNDVLSDAAKAFIAADISERLFLTEYFYILKDQK